MLLKLAQSGPVFIQKHGRNVAVVVSPDEFIRVAEAAGGFDGLMVKKLHAESVERWSKVYKALTK